MPAPGEFGGMMPALEGSAEALRAAPATISLMADPPAPTERRSRTPLPPTPNGGEKSSRMTRPSRSGMRFLGIVVLLLAIHWGTVARFAPGREPTITVPFSPMFENQVRENNV